MSLGCGVLGLKFSPTPITTAMGWDRVWAASVLQRGAHYNEHYQLMRLPLSRLPPSCSGAHYNKN
eukprot:scaffold75134_cov18-Tisochrysis_lutea.AAC.2